MTKEILEFKLPSGDNCELCMTELNHNVVALEPHISLSTPNISPTHLQDIINYIISLNRTYIKSLYFEKIKYTYRIVSFNLFGHIRAALKKELRTPVLYDDLVSNKDNYNWVESPFLPKFCDDIDVDINCAIDGSYLLHYCHEDSTFKNINYKLSSPEFIYNYVYDLHPTDLIPVFDIYIKTTLTVPSNTSPELVSEIKSFLIQRFNEFDYSLVLL